MPGAPDTLVLSVVNPKGGTGKTTIAAHLATAVHRAGYGAVLLDTDPQGSAVDWHRRAPDGYDGPTVESVTGPAVLKSDLGRLTSGHAVAVLDSPARLDETTGAVLSVSDVALVPVQPSGLDLWGTAEFLDVVTEHVERGGLTAAFVGSRRDVRTSLSGELLDVLRGKGLPLLDGTTQRVGYARSMSEGQTVLDGYDRTAADEVTALVSDVGQLAS